MKIRRKAACLLMLLLFLSFWETETVFATGEGNMDGGGGGFGAGTSTNKWVNGDEGVRVTIVRASDGAVVSASVDLTNVNPGNIVKHFTKTCKIAYKSGASLTPDTGTYGYINQGQSLPRIISTSSGGGNIAQIKRYFTDEQVIRGIAGYCGFDFDTLISGEYKLLIEPLAYVTFQGTRTAMTATEAAMYDRMLGGLMHSKMPSLSHKNLPLAIFLETLDLGFPAWTGSKTERVSNESIISSLGIGIVRFNEMVTPPELEAVDYEYRVNTDVITAVTITGGQSVPAGAVHRDREVSRQELLTLMGTIRPIPLPTTGIMHIHRPTRKYQIILRKIACIGVYGFHGGRNTGYGTAIGNGIPVRIVKPARMDARQIMEAGWTKVNG